MRQNTPIVAVLLAGLVLAAGVVGVASLREGEPGPEDVAIRVGAVEATFAELELRREAVRASDAIWQRLRDGDDFGLSEDVLEELRLAADLLGPMRTTADDELGTVAMATAAAATEATALDLARLSPEEIATRVQERIETTQRFMTSDSSTLGFAQAQHAAIRAALGEERYRMEYLPRQARSGVATDLLLMGRDLPAADFGTAAATAGMEEAQEADIWLHPSLKVSVEEVRDYLDELYRFQWALAEWPPETADSD